MSFLGLGASTSEAYDEDDSSVSVIHHDSDNDDPIHDDDVDIGFRRHQYETFHDDDDDDDDEGRRRGRPQRKSRQQAQEEALYGVFMENSGGKSQGRTSSDIPGGAPLFVAASKPDHDASPMFVKATTSMTTTTIDGQPDHDVAPMFVKATTSATTTTIDGHLSSSSSPPAPLNDKNSESADKQSRSSTEPRENDEIKPPQEAAASASAVDDNIETAAEQDVKEKQKAADEYFQSLLQQAQDKKRRKRPRSPDPPAAAAAAAATTGVMPPPGMVPTGFGRSHRMDATTAAAPAKKDPSIATWERHEKGIGSKLLFKMGWKGIGGLGSNRRKFQSKTAAESGSTGDASKVAAAAPTQPTSQAQDDDARAKKGISRPVEVVVRPANLGLGFGNFKEMSKLKSNLQIEAEVRGIELPDQKKKKRKKGVLDFLEDQEHGNDDDSENDDVYDASQSRTASSAIPTMQELMTQKAWKKRKTKRVAPKIIPYEELVKQQEQTNSGQTVIIDMRGPSPALAGTAMGQDDKSSGTVPLGEELLHNVTFMLNTHENQLHSYSQIVKSTERKEASLQSEIAGLRQQQQQAKERREQLEKALAVVDKVEQLVAQESSLSSSISSDGLKLDPLEQVIQWIEELAGSFTEEDRTALNFWQALAPALLSPILQERLERWDPLGPTKATQELLDSLFHIQTQGSSENDKTSLEDLRYSILSNQLLPRIKQVLESSRWDPSSQTEVVVDMYEYLHTLVGTQDKGNKENVKNSEDQVFSGGLLDEDYVDEKRHGHDLAEIFRKELVLDTIYPKLQTTLSRWKPSLSSSSQGVRIEQRLDLWILPWMPHLDHPAILSNLLSECKRKIKSSLSYLQRKIGKENDIDFVIAARDVLRPWLRVYDLKILEGLTSEYVTPYLARASAKVKVHRDPRDQNWSCIQVTMELHSLGLLSDIEFASVLEAELLPRWMSKLIDMLVDKTIEIEQAAAQYLSWKKQILMGGPFLKGSRLLVQQDNHICAMFYTVLQMIQLARTSESMNELEVLYPPTSNYHVSSARRTKERQSRVEDDFVRMEAQSPSEAEARLRLRQRRVETPSFRDVVEEFANERGIIFQPRMGAKALKDGNQIFLIGTTPIYIEGDVIYTSQGGTWKPTSLDKLV